jgi:hypothetical protein
MALTLVQQDVYDRSRGRQLPISKAVCRRWFALAAAICPNATSFDGDGRPAPRIWYRVSSTGADRNMPLAPLYAALIRAIGAAIGRRTPPAAAEAAESYGQFQAELVKYASDDPRVPTCAPRPRNSDP